MVAFGVSGINCSSRFRSNKYLLIFRCMSLSLIMEWLHLTVRSFDNVFYDRKNE